MFNFKIFNFFSFSFTYIILNKYYCSYFQIKYIYFNLITFKKTIFFLLFDKNIIARTFIT